MPSSDLWREVDCYGGTGQIGKDELTAVYCRKIFRQIFEALNASRTRAFSPGSAAACERIN
ncbi:MAG: hypothetical protein KIH64_013370 [Mycobacterium sp.]|nr:hypothetical protein [Mycobacterium sp.]